MGVAAITGFQGKGFPIADDKVLTTLKHMTGHGEPEGGQNVGPAQVSERVLREKFFPPFEAAVKEAGAASVMASYNENKIVNDIGEAGALSLKSGVDMELPDGIAFYALKEKIETGEYDIKYVDQAVRRVLEMKLRGNIFETPYSDGAEADALTGNQEARDVALEAAHKAAVLLKNEDNILPLDASKYNKIAVIGPNAAITVLGGYSDYS